jgi:hypothetical protein
MDEGTLQETLIAVGATIVVLGAVGALLWRITVGDPQKRRLDKLKAELEAEKKK